LYAETTSNFFVFFRRFTPGFGMIAGRNRCWTLNPGPAQAIVPVPGSKGASANVSVTKKQNLIGILQ